MIRMHPPLSATFAGDREEKKFPSLLWVGVCVMVVSILFMFFAYKSGKTPPPSEYSAREIFSDKPISLTDYRGSAIILMSWATWCMDCEEELAALEQLWNSEQGRGLVVVAVNLDGVEANERIERMVTQYQLTYPVWRDPENVFFSTFNTPGIPTTVLLDRHGMVLRAWVGPVDFNSINVRSEIETALGE